MDELRSAAPTAQVVIVPVGPAGMHGLIALEVRDGADPAHDRLLATLGASQADVALRSLALEREVVGGRDRLAAVEKLSALGQLVAGVAHEIRTPLTYAGTNLSILRQRLARVGPEAGETAEPFLREAQGALDRINAIVGELRRFARQERRLVFLEDLRPPVEEALHLFRATHTNLAPIRERLRPTPPVRVDRGQIQQLVLNLVENATQAPGATTVTVETWAEGGMAVLAVEDDGAGIPPETRERLFEPFFTTKPSGLGLGLSIVARIVADHGGIIRVESPAGGGTRMRVQIPRGHEPAPPDPAAPSTSVRG